MNKEKQKIFISHSWEDNEISRKLSEYLRQDGADVWIDFVKIKLGDSFIKKMNDGLEWCNTFILLWSKSAAKSKYVSKEWEGAFANNLKIIPCLLDETKLPILLSGIIYKDLNNFDEGYNSLAMDLNLIEKPIKQKKIKRISNNKQKKLYVNSNVIKQNLIVLRKTTKELDLNDVRRILTRYDFYCENYGWNKDYCNPDGKGVKNDFVLLKNGKIVHDKEYDLIWQQSGSQNILTYKKALYWIEQINKEKFSGFSDWRLPTLEEAMSLMKPERKNDRYINPIFDSKQHWIWTCDKVKGESQRWVAGFSYGNCTCEPMSIPYYIRAVRSVQAIK